MEPLGPFEQAIRLLFYVGLIGIALSIVLWKLGGGDDFRLGSFTSAMVIQTIVAGGIWWFLRFGLAG